MTLSLEQIKEIILKNPNKHAVQAAVKNHDLLNMHVNGVGAKEFISKIKKYENKAQKEIHDLLLEPNKGLYSSVLNPTNKVFSAKGGARRYNINSDAQKRDFKELISNVAHGLSTRNWLQKKIFNKYITDPNGILFIEVSEDGTKANPTFKSSNSIHDIKFTGQKVEYVIFKPIKDEQIKDKSYYRVVDDVADYWIDVERLSENTTITINEEKTLQNYFGKCPAMVVSDIFDNVSDIKNSFISDTLEKASKFFIDNTVHTVHKLLHGFSKYWEYGRECLSCNGDGVLKNSEGQKEKCNVCDGSGYRQFGDVTDKIILPFPTDKEDPILTKLSGFESPDIAIWQEYKKDIQEHKEDIYYTLWNTSFVRGQKSKTATESVLDVQPINEKLHTISDNFERLESFVTDMLGVFYYPNTYQGCSINYGRRYLVEGADVVFEKLTKAIKNKMPVAFILNIAKEYIQSLYANNEIEIAVQLKLLEIEPFPFLSIQEVKTIDVEDEEYKKKVFFQEWLKTKTDAEKMLMTKEDLTKNFQQFINNKNLKKNEAQTLPMRGW